LKNYIFSINQSGDWINSSIETFSGTTNVSSNVTQITASSGTVSWKFYAQDRHGNWNQTEVQTFTVGGNVGTLNITLLSPLGSNNQPVNQTFVLYANVTCTGSPGDSCGNVNGTLLYNSTGASPNTAVQENGVFATPFYTSENNPLTCGSLSVASAPCALNWTINATGALNSIWKLAVNASSDSVSAKISDNSTISIIDNTLSISISDELASVSFGTTLNPNTQNNSAVNNSNNGYSIVCTYTGGNCNISIKGNDNLFSGANVLGITNISWNQNNSLNGKQKLSLAYVSINQSLQNLATQLLYFWLDVPTNQVAGTYTGNFTVQGQAN
jgi:hypothetical protein